MKKFKVDVDGDVIENFVGWSTPSGNLVQLEFVDGSIRLLAGWVDVTIQVVSADKF